MASPKEPDSSSSSNPQNINPKSTENNNDDHIKGEEKEKSGCTIGYSSAEDHLNSGSVSVIFFTVASSNRGDDFHQEEEEEVVVEHETALVPRDAPVDDIKDMFRSAAEAGPCDIIKLYTTTTTTSTNDGGSQLLNISPLIPPNTPSTPYRLEVVAVHCNAIIMEQLGIDLLSLEKRLSSLEHNHFQCVSSSSSSSPNEAVQDLKREVNQLRSKIENYEYLSWLGFYKALHPPPLLVLDEQQQQEQHHHHHHQTTPPPPYYHRRCKEAKQVVIDKFLRLSDVILKPETCELLRSPAFDNWQWEDEEMLVLLQQMYLELELPRKFDIEISVLRNFISRVYHNYNDVPFHNFRHCFCVTQMMYGMTWKVNLPERIGDLETLILLTSCICHDLDHPGYNNIYQINAQTELALRYNDISPLENHHCSVAFRILEDPDCNIFRNVSGETFKRIREGMIRCILATDMARHNDIVSQFKEVVPYFDKGNVVHVNLLSMVMIKVADISNEARPMNVAEPWLDCLLTEFFQQSNEEKLEGLPVTPFMDPDKITKPSSQCSFIGLVLLPLFEVLGSFFPELDPMIIQPVRDALDYYRRLNEAQLNQPPSSSSSTTIKHRKSTDLTNTNPAPPSSSCTNNQLPSEEQNDDDDDETNDDIELLPPPPSPPPPIPHRNSNPLSYRRASQLLMLKASGSSNSLKVSSSLRGNSNYQSFPSVESEDGNAELAITEVEVSEKALKFKIATEPSFDYSSNISASRKGSRENNKSSESSSVILLKDNEVSRVGSGGGGEFVSTSSSTPVKTMIKPKDSFFSRLRMFTDRFSTDESSSSSSSTTGNKQTFNYFRRKGSKKHHAYTSSSDTEEKHVFNDNDDTATAATTDFSPIMSISSSRNTERRKSSTWKQKHCSGGSLDSVLSNKDDNNEKENTKHLQQQQQQRSPSGRRLMLPRFSSFVQRRTPGFMRRGGGGGNRSSGPSPSKNSGDMTAAVVVTTSTATQQQQQS